MRRPPPGTIFKTRGGWRFRVTEKTTAVALAPLAMDPPAAWLLANGNNAVILTPSGEAWSPSPRQAVAMVDRLNAAREAAGEPPLTLPKELLRMARNLGNAPDLPWSIDENEGYSNNAGETLNVHRPTGAAVLVRQDTPPKLTPLQAAAWQPTYTVERIGVRAALDWLKAAGFRLVPASLARRGKADMPEGGDDESSPRHR